jgi:hypothetical protein
MMEIKSNEFRASQRKYFDLACTERIIIRRGNNQSFALVPTHDEDFSLSPRLAAKLDSVRAEVEAGKCTVHQSHDEIDEFFASL